jgi:pimeloyl-ACP methyl ester carboxylesterase
MRHTLLLRASIGLLVIGVAATGSNEPRVLDRLVDIGGYRLYVKCIGVGSPTVILEAGLGSNSNTWDKVMPEVGNVTRVCSYDRPNEGKSDPAPRVVRRVGSHKFIELRTGQQIVQDLHAVLAKAEVAGPYVLVGHSLGGLYAILYANQYPRTLSVWYWWIQPIQIRPLEKKHS